MIENDEQLQTSMERIAWFQKQVAQLRKTETNPTNYRAAVSGFLSEIDRMQLDVLETGVLLCLGCDLGDVELVVDVAVESETFVVQDGDRLACQLERNRLMPQPLAVARLRDDSALVADERIVEPGLQGEGPRGLEHPSRHEDDVDPCRVGRAKRGARSLVQDDVLADQRAVEVAGNRRHLLRKVRRELQPCGLVRKSTRSFRSDAGSVLYDFGMTFFG